MNVILQVTAIASDDPNQLVFIVKITQGAELVTREEDLLEELKDSLPSKRGIISVQRLSTSIWAVTTHKK